MIKTPAGQIKNFIIDRLTNSDYCREDWDLSKLRETLDLDSLAILSLLDEVLDSLIGAGQITRQVLGPEHDPSEHFALVDDKREPPRYGSRREFRGLAFSFNGSEYRCERGVLTVHLQFQDEEPQCRLTWWEDIDCCAEADIVLNEDSVMVHDKEFGNLEDLVTWFGENI